MSVTCLFLQPVPLSDWFTSFKAAPPTSALPYFHWSRQTAVTGASTPPPHPPSLGALRLFFSLKSSDESFNNGVATAGGCRSLPMSGIRELPVDVDWELFSGVKSILTDNTMTRDGVNLRWEPALQTVWNCWTVAGSALPCRYCVSEVGFYIYFYYFTRLENAMTCLISAFVEFSSDKSHWNLTEPVLWQEASPLRD